MRSALSGASTANGSWSERGVTVVPLRRRATDPADSSWSDAQRLRYWWQAERERLLTALSSVPANAADHPLAPGAWSPRGIAAHRLFWEAEERAALEQYLSGLNPSLLEFPVERIDPTNAAAVEALGERQLSALQRALSQLRERSRALVEQIADTDLDTQGNPARILLGVALEHDREHRQELERALKLLPGRDEASRE